ncbi:MAG: tetratricopeptide repeat protein, partial [Candidatus Omnitrophota bacterium]
MRAIKYIFITISAILVLYTSLNAEENSDFSLGKKSFQDGFYEVAAKSLEKFLSEKPEGPDILDARLLLGESCVHLNRFSDAMAQLDSVINSEAKPDMKDEAAYWKSEIYFRTRDFEKARELYSAILDRSPSSNYAPYVKYAYAWSLYEEKKYQEALDKFSAFLSEYPKSELKEDSEVKIGEILYRLKKYDQSRDMLSKFVQETKDTKKAKLAYFYIGENYYYQGDYKNA